MSAPRSTQALASARLVTPQILICNRFISRPPMRRDLPFVGINAQIAKSSLGIFRAHQRFANQKTMKSEPAKVTQLLRIAQPTLTQHQSAWGCFGDQAFARA